MDNVITSEQFAATYRGVMVAVDEARRLREKAEDAAKVERLSDMRTRSAK